MNLLVTGGCGFIGSNFVRQRLLDAKTSSQLNLKVEVEDPGHGSPAGSDSAASTSTSTPHLNSPAPASDQLKSKVEVEVSDRGCAPATSASSTSTENFNSPAAISRLVNLDKLTYAGNPANLTDLADDPRYVFVQGDIGDEELVGRLLREHEIDAVVNFAAESHVDRSIDSPEPFVQTNVVGTLRILNAARHYWATLPDSKKGGFRFLHVSTDEVYGTLAPDDPAFTEETPFAPNSPYAASKAASDHLVRAYQHTYKLPTLTTNCSNNYGPFHFPEKLIPLVILNALDGKPLPVYGDGQQIRDWLFVEDHVAAIWLVLQRGRIGETYNIGGLNERANLDVVRHICTLLDEKSPRTDGRSYSVQITFVTDRPGHDRRYAIDCTKIQRELGWSPRESFETGLARTVDWYLAHREWCEEITATRYARGRLGAKGIEV